jgi:hypothetical protein
MQNVTNFINLLGENYYLDFIIEPYAEEVDYDKHFVLVHYQDKKYYEQTHEYIQIRQNEIINEVKSLFQKSISDIYLEVSKKKNSEIENFLNLNIKAANVKLNILKNDFYIENDNSRYFAILYDDADPQTLETFFSKRDYSTTTTNIEIRSIVQKLNSGNIKSPLPYSDSDFFVEFHLQRYKLLSFLPFKLFHIAHRFIVELEKIKELSPVSKLNKAKINIEQSQSGSTMNKKDTYFDKFCELIDDYTILKKSTAIGVMVDLEDCIKKIKSETLLELQNKTDHRDDYLDYLINEIEKQSYPKNANISYVQKWLDEYKISIEDIFNRDYRNNSIEAVIDRHYNDMDKFSSEKDKAHSVQLDFYQFICKHYADELIAYFNSKKDKKQSNIPSKPQTPMKPFKDEYLNVFCKEISDERVIKETCFDLVYEGIVHYVPYLETEIIENLLLLGNDKRDDYLNFAIDKIKKTPFVGNDKINIDKWLKKYNVSIDEFPKFSNKELSHWLNRYYNGYSETPNDLDFILDIQIDFYCYAAMVEANKMINFLESKRTNVNKGNNKIENSDETENVNQLSVNQAIILLDRLGLFSSTMLENLPNTKKAKLISQLIGKNDKNIKTAIEKLELKASEIKPNHQRDIDKIERLLGNLE